MKPLYYLVLAIVVSTAASAQKIYLQCGTFIDGISSTPRSEITLVVEGNTIRSVEKGYVSGGPQDRVIDLRHKTVLPGLIDCHVHLESQQNKNSLIEAFRLTEADIAFRSIGFAKKTLQAGFTTVRDCGGTGVNTALRNAIAQGLVPGPTIISAGTAISASGGHMDPSNGFRDDAFRVRPGPGEGIADGKDELIKAVRLQFKKGADFIKIASTGGVLDLSANGSGAQFSLEEIKTVVETAKDYGMRVACHAHGAEGIRRAILAGVTSIEHGSLMNQEDMDLCKKYGTYYVPTLTAGKSVADSAKIPGFFPKVIADKALLIGPKLQQTFKLAYQAGLKIAFGTDAGVYAHGKNALEFVYMVQGGMKPMEAIQSATKTAAELLGILGQYGTLEPGKMADIIATDENPLQNISALLQVGFVMKHGLVYP